MKQLRYGTLNDAFKEMIESMRGEMWPICDCNSVAARTFFIEMNRFEDDEAVLRSLDERLSTIEARIKRLAALLETKPAFKDAKAFSARLMALLGNVDDSKLLLVWMFLFGMKPGVLEKYGLDCTLSRMLDRNGSRHRINLLMALLALPEVSAMPAHVFSAPACRAFLSVQESRGTEWFSKERFEELAEWLATIGLIDAAKPLLSAGAVAAAMAKAESVLQYSRRLAAHIGYRAGLYRRMLPGGSDQMAQA